MRDLRFKSVLAFTFLTLGSLAQAGVEDVYASGLVNSRWLNVPASARVAGLAGAFAAQGNELGAMDINPAGLAGVETWQASFTHNAWVEGTSVERAAGALHVGRAGTLALGLSYLNLGEIETVTMNSAGQPVIGGMANPSSMAADGAWALALGEFSLGLALKATSEDYLSTRTWGYEGDAGLRWVSGQGFRAGVAVQNLAVDGNSLARPMRVRAGLGYTFDTFKPLALDVNADMQPNDQEPATFRGAAEWAATDSFLLRAGYIQGNANQPSGPTAGLGWLAGIVEFDYAAYAVGPLGLSHLFTLRLVP